MVEISIKYPLSRETALELREQVMAVVLDSLKSVHTHDEGFSLNFGRESTIIKALSQMIEIERVVNPFLRMTLIVESNPLNEKYLATKRKKLGHLLKS